MRIRWRFFGDDRSFQLTTPWFMLAISDGGWEWEINCRWWGVKLYWQPNWNAPQGAPVFQREKEWIMRRVAAELLEVYPHLAV
jgi:hypothetical protein